MAKFSWPEMYHNLANLLSAGVPVVRSINVLMNSYRGKPRRIFDDIRQSIAEGSSIAEAMRNHQSFFNHQDIILIDSGERSGNLEEILKSLAQWYETRRRIMRNIKSGLILPVILIHAASLLGPFPKFILMENYTLENYIIEGLSILSFFYIPLLFVLGIMIYTPKTGFLRRGLDAIALRIPILGSALHNLALFRFCQSFNMMLRAGVPAVECAENAVNSTGNTVIMVRLQGIIESAREGNTYSEGFSRRLPFDFRESWSVGEETGELDNVTARQASQKADQAEFKFKQFSEWLPRIIYACVALLMMKLIFEAYAAVYGGLLGCMTQHFGLNAR